MVYKVNKTSKPRRRGAGNIGDLSPFHFASVDNWKCLD